MRASSAPHSVSARSGGYSVVTIHILSACIIGASVSNVSIPDVPVVPCCPRSFPWTYLLSPVVPDGLQLSWMSQIIPGCSSCPKSTPVVLCTWSSSIVPIHPQMCWTSMAVREVHASSAPHLVSARSGGYSVLLSPLYKCVHHRRLTWFRRAAGDIRL